jgi:hypothetical protein
MEKTKHRSNVTKYLIIAIFVLLTIELLRLGLTYLSVRSAVRYAIHYGEVGEYDRKYCVSDCLKGSEDLRQARVKSINDAALIGFKKYSDIFIINAIDEERLEMEICSDREGVSYSEETHSCSPHQDPGEDGGLIYITANFPYSIGSSFGFEFGNIQLTTSKISRAYCYRLGCWSSLEIHLSGSVPDGYTIEASASDGRHRFLDCSEVPLIEIDELNHINHGKCTTKGVGFDGFDPAEVEITVSWYGGSTTETYTPRYRIFRPNGLRCEPTCLSGEIVIEIPG